MLAIVKESAAPGVALKDMPKPSPKPGEVLVRVIHGSICGTDIGLYDWIPWAAEHVTPPIILGHELLGEIVEINPGTDGEGDAGLAIGDLVSSETHIFCNHCHQCQVNNRHVCENMKLFGLSRDGAFAEFATIPIRTTWKNDPSLDRDFMSVQEPLGNAVYVVEKGNVADKKVLVLGLGPTGLCAGAVAKAYGAQEVVGLDPQEYRRDLGQKMGLDRVQAKIDRVEHGTFDVVLEMSGNAGAIQAGLDAVCTAGRFVAFGIPKTPISIDWGKYLINKELRIRSVFGRRIWETWHQMQDLLRANRVNLRPLITHRFPLAEFEKAMEVMKSGECGKILLINSGVL